MNERGGRKGMNECVYRQKSEKASEEQVSG